MNAAQRRKYSKRVERINRRYEDKWLNRIQKTIQGKANVVIARLRNGGTQSAFQYLSVDISNPALAGEIEKLYREVGLVHAKRVSDELRSEPKILRKSILYRLAHSAEGFVVKRLGFNEQWARFINDYLERFLFEKITWSINNTTRDALMRAVQKGINDGLGVDDIIRILETWPYARFQAARIIRTEINRATNVGSMAGGETFAYEQQKEWIAAKDNRTRGNPRNGQEDHANHWQLDGTVIDEEALFTDNRNGDQLRFPGDPNASAASVVNCRCSVALIAKRDERGRLIPKKSRISIVQPGQIPRRPTITI